MSKGDKNYYQRQTKLNKASDSILCQKEKQHRIYSWLGVQTSDFLPPVNVSDAEEKHCNNVSGNYYCGKNKSPTKTKLSKSRLITSPCKVSDLQHETVYNGHVHQSKKASPLDVPTDLKHVSAATKIQASWRGFLARSRNARVIEIRHELRARRMEHYINTLCHELCVLKEKQKADRKLKELQTEAIRFMWSQVRQLQGKFESRFQEMEASLSASISSKDKVLESCSEKENVSWNEVGESNELKQTVEKLQTQVLQLQEALLSFSDKLVSENEDNIVMRNVPNGENEIESDIEKSDSSEEETCENKETTAAAPLSLELPTVGEEEILSARDKMPKISLHNILVDLDSCLTEKELWAFCEQATQTLNSLKNIEMRYISPSTIFIRKDGLVSYSTPKTLVDLTYSAPEMTKEENLPSLKSLIFSLAVAMWSAADYNLSEEQAPCLSQSFEILLDKMSHDDVSQRAEVEEVLKYCSEYHTSSQCNSLQLCASLYAEACDIKRGKKRQTTDVNFIEFFAKDMEKTRHNFRIDVCPQISQVSFKLKPASARQLLPKPEIAKTPHEEIMSEIIKGPELRQVKKPDIYSVQDLFRDNPELIEKLNILPGQQQKNIRAANIAIRKSSPNGKVKPGIPTAPRTLKAEIKREVSDLKHQNYDDKACTLILRWHPSSIFDKYGNKSKASDILGYRIYVNGQPKGMVTGTKCRALLDGLKRSTEYRIHVCAVATLGESDFSNTIIANLKDKVVKTSFKSPKQLSPSLKSSGLKFSSINSSEISYQPEATSPLEMQPDKLQSADVVDRVLRRYGIKKSTSSSTSPAQNLIPSKNSSSFNDGYNMHHVEDSCGIPCLSHENLQQNNNYATSSSSSDDHITPRTKALLDQLKDELLS